MNALLGLAALLLIALCFLSAALVRQRREFQQALNDLPTGLCVISGDERVLNWNSQMASFSGLAPNKVQGRRLSMLPAPWPDALGEALAEKEGRVIKQALDGSAGDKRWVILHSSQPLRDGSLRQIVVEDITDYERLHDELEHKERLASIGRLAAGVAHEIGNPVTGIACVAQNLADSADAGELEQGTAEILKQTERITRTVAALMQLSHPGSGSEIDYAACNLADCVDEAVHLLSLDRESTSAEFENRCDREQLVLADSQLLLQVFLNLLDNAQTAAAGDGPVRVHAALEDGHVRICVDNLGDPVSQEVLDQAFEPFFTTKDVGEGTGLGLALVRRMIEDMGGQISLLSPLPSNTLGVRAELTLPTAKYEIGYTTDTDFDESR
ncbi:MAG: ATP-binding protein [Pseudomonadota bacterium]